MIVNDYRVIVQQRGKVQNLATMHTLRRYKRRQI